MSRKMRVGLVFAEKLFGIILAVIGAELAYHTWVNPGVAGVITGLFFAAGVSLVVLGLILLIARTG